MMCSRPFRKDNAEFGCGQCLPCKMNRRRLWTSRLMLEAQKHEFSRFVTLTYAPEFLPEDGNVSVRALQLYLKRLRELVKPVRFRYYAVGEYGTLSGRAHYHIALFGVSDDDSIRAAWKFGAVHIGMLTPESASYIVSYVTKGRTGFDVAGRVPEFCRMSLRPGIGADAMPDFGDAVLDRDGVLHFVDGDVPSFFRVSGKSYPLGRYLRQRLRLSLGMEKKEPFATGRIRAFRRFVDLAEAGKRGWQGRLAWFHSREGRRLRDLYRVFKKLEISNSKRGIGL